MTMTIKEETLNILVARVYDLGEILVADDITQLCDKVAYSHYEYTSFDSMGQLKEELLKAVIKDVKDK